MKRLVSKSSLFSVTEYVIPNCMFFHSDGMLPSMALERPKSNLTDESPWLLGVAEDSDDDLPRYSHLDIRAKPC